METAFGIVCVIVFLLFVLGPVLRRWTAPMIQRWMMRKMEDRFRRMAGMPTRKEERKARKRTAGASPHRRTAKSTVDILQYVAEDVEFTEIKSYSDDSMHDASRAKVKYREEEQIEDANFTEIHDSN